MAGLKLEVFSLCFPFASKLVDAWSLLPLLPSSPLSPCLSTPATPQTFAFHPLLLLCSLLHLSPFYTVPLLPPPPASTPEPTTPSQNFITFCLSIPLHHEIIATVSE